MKFKGRWLPETEVYKDTCLRLAKDMSNFKQDPHYIKYVGNDNRSSFVVQAFDDAVHLPYINANDAIGNPKLYNGKSAGTLRYMKVVQDTYSRGIEKIVEIGGGYGGQALVYRHLYDVDYTIIDIPEALKLSGTYLKDVGCNLISSENVPETECDLLISDYCLSELDDEGVDFYLSRVMGRNLYVTSNAQGERRESLLSRIGKDYTFYVTPEYPKTSHHDNYVIIGKIR